MTRTTTVPNVPVVAQTTKTGTPDAVRAELARRRVSGRELATRLGWSERTLRRRLAGQTPFTVDELTSVASFLDVPVLELLPAEQASP